MAYGSAAYRLDGYTARVPQPSRAPDVRAVRTGAGQAPAPSPVAATLAKMAAVLIVVVAVLSFVRIALTNEAVTTMIESEELSSQIAQARSAGVGLEMEQSVLANPSAIKASAKKLGMAAPLSIGTVELSPDIVAVGADGSLSLSGTVRNAVGAQG